MEEQLDAQQVASKRPKVVKKNAASAVAQQRAEERAAEEAKRMVATLVEHPNSTDGSTRLRKIPTLATKPVAEVFCIGRIPAGTRLEVLDQQIVSGIGVGQAGVKMYKVKKTRGTIEGWLKAEYLALDRPFSGDDDDDSDNEPLMISARRVQRTVSAPLRYQ